MTKFLHISDLHVHGHKEDNEAVNAVLQHIGGDDYRDHVLLITGDLTDDGSREQYHRLEEILPNNKMAIVPGNHDYGALGNLYSKERADRFDDLCCTLGLPGTFAGDCMPMVQTFDNVLVVGLDSNLETLEPYDFACGEIGKKQLVALWSILESAKGMFKIVMMHHHPFIFNDPFMEMKDARELSRVLHRRADLLLFGHKHVTGHWTNRWGIPNVLAAGRLQDRSAAEIVIDEGVVKKIVWKWFGYRYLLG